MPDEQLQVRREYWFFKLPCDGGPLPAADSLGGCSC